MRTAIAMTTAVLLLLTGVAAAQTTYSAILNGAQETPPVATPATGSGSFTLDNSTKILSYNITFSGLLGTESAAHIHGPAAAGMMASPIFGLPSGNPKVGTTPALTPQQEADLNAGLWYVNIHSSLHSGGEIRGQILPTVSVDARTWGAVKQLYRP